MFQRWNRNIAVSGLQPAILDITAAYIKVKTPGVRFKSLSLCDCLEVNRMHQLAFQQYTFRNYSTWPCHWVFQFLNPLPFFYDRFKKSSWKLCWIYIVGRIDLLTGWRMNLTGSVFKELVRTAERTYYVVQSNRLNASRELTSLFFLWGTYILWEECWIFECELWWYVL